MLAGQAEAVQPPVWVSASYASRLFTIWVDRRRGYVETHFFDGAVCVGCVEGNDLKEYAATAIRAGYGNDLALCAIQNDLLHSWLAERAGLPFSPALWGTAHKRWYPGWEAEESVVFGLQCLLNGGQLSDWHMLAVARYIKWLRPKTTLTPLVSEARAWLAQFEPG